MSNDACVCMCVYIANIARSMDCTSSNGKREDRGGIPSVHVLNIHVQVLSIISNVYSEKSIADFIDMERHVPLQSLSSFLWLWFLTENREREQAKVVAYLLHHCFHALGKACWMCFLNIYSMRTHGTSFFRRNFTNLSRTCLSACVAVKWIVVGASALYAHVRKQFTHASMRASVRPHHLEMDAYASLIGKKGVVHDSYRVLTEVFSEMDHETQPCKNVSCFSRGSWVSGSLIHLSHGRNLKCWILLASVVCRCQQFRLRKHAYFVFIFGRIMIRQWPIIRFKMANRAMRR